MGRPKNMKLKAEIEGHWKMGKSPREIAAALVESGHVRIGEAGVRYHLKDICGSSKRRQETAAPGPMPTPPEPPASPGGAITEAPATTADGKLGELRARIMTLAKRGFGHKEIAAKVARQPYTVLLHMHAMGIAPAQAVAPATEKPADGEAGAQRPTQATETKYRLKTAVGLSVKGGQMHPMLLAGSALPAEKSEAFDIDGEAAVVGAVVVGRTPLGSIRLDLESAEGQRRGAVVTFSCDGSGALKVSAAPEGGEPKVLLETRLPRRMLEKDAP